MHSPLHSDFKLLRVALRHYPSAFRQRLVGPHLPVSEVPPHPLACSTPQTRGPVSPHITNILSPRTTVNQI